LLIITSNPLLAASSWAHMSFSTAADALLRSAAAEGSMMIFHSPAFRPDF
jgi:hypothetical protein